MIIKLDDKNIEKCKRFLSVKEDNISAAEIYIEYLNYHYNDITQKDVESLRKKYPNNAYYKAFLNKLAIDENDKDFLSINNTCRIDKIDCLNPDEFYQDEYAKNIIVNNINEGNWYLTRLNYEPYEGFVYDEIEVDEEYYAEHTPFGYFNEKFNYVAVIEDEAIWMSIIPHEINTMKKPIKDAFGKVLVLGLGLGYYAYHIALKDDVESITVIENDEKVISIFNKYILPHFKNKEKIRIIHQDALAHLDEMHDYDFVFADIWHNVGDGLILYLKIKQYEGKYKNTTFSYWIETSLLAMLRRQTLTVFEEQFFDHLDEKEYLKARNDNDKVINAIYFALKNYGIKNADDLHRLLNDDSLKELAKKLKP